MECLQNRSGRSRTMWFWDGSKPRGKENTVGKNSEVKRPAQERGNAKIISLDEVRHAQMSPRPDRTRPPLKGPKVVALHRRETREELLARKLAEFERLVEQM